ncbi:amidohydrolase [Amycolatopsis acidiphila]|uniref:Peptidase M20 domain-containing protein 2 n=1 Tax=Amycolatopsis acidiphila TaxID=715473 RepID=A0A558ACT2_9PSEU|nr:amidohydrolase [Amycolatopsis acidiphila]TVT22003.1 M20 family metallopeptidase [Amycolatopsis acidiphila]UIJ63683.1 amidohydrolase [Amycolatopsis acidiphila]GHG67478.1 amidohydrolase [Amycolatopsis acidiphila]
MSEHWYRAVDAQVDRLADRLWDIAGTLHRDPEQAFEEHRAAKLLSDELASGGFAVERGVAGMPTAFTGTAGAEGPRVALLLEYDALPGLGHACGHNLIAAAGLGAALAVRPLLDEVPGTVLAVGTPAEEGGGGKVVELEAGVFEGVDAALMFHPGTHSWSWAPLTAQTELAVRFAGRAAHPTGNPTEGVDALAALIEMFNVLSVLQRRLPAGSHVQGIITAGGKATNIVPDLAEGRFGLRGLTTPALDELARQVREVAAGVARATGTTAQVERPRAGYAHFRDNKVLSGAFARHLGELGLPMTEPEPGVFLGSSDIGDLSTAMPAIHPFVAITGPEQSDHTPEFAAAAVSERARTALSAATKALARTAVDVLTGADTVAAAWAEFHRRAAAEAGQGVSRR